MLPALCKLIVYDGLRNYYAGSREQRAGSREQGALSAALLLPKPFTIHYSLFTIDYSPFLPILEKTKPYDQIQ
jgi:hypothetical protein